MSLDDYLEKSYAEGYRQQIADEENVPRSLPFFATAFAVLVAIIAASKDLIPDPSLDYYPIIVWVLILLLTICLLASMIYLLIALWPRDFKYVMSELDLHNYVVELRKYYAFDADLSEEDRAAAILEDLRDELSKQYRIGAANNRAINFGRASKRATALCLLVIALILAFVMIAVILGNEKYVGASNAGAGRQSENRGSSQTITDARPAGTNSQEAIPAALTDYKEGRMD